MLDGAHGGRRPDDRLRRRVERRADPDLLDAPRDPRVRAAAAPARERARDLAGRRDGDLARRAPGGPVSDGRHARALDARRRRRRARSWNPCRRRTGRADGASLVVLRTVDGRSRIEFPMGKTVVEVPSGYLSHPRVSPDGDLVAYLEHPMRGDDGGSVAVVDRQGKRQRPLRRAGSRCAGSPGRRTAAKSGSRPRPGAGARALHAVSLSGTEAPGSAGAGRAHAPRHLSGGPRPPRPRKLEGRASWACLRARSASGTSRGTTGPGRSTSRPTAPRCSSTRRARAAARPTPCTSARPTARPPCGWATAMRSPSRPTANGRSRRRTARRRSSCSCPPGRGSRGAIQTGHFAQHPAGRLVARRRDVSSSERTARTRRRGCTCSAAAEASLGPSRPKASARRGPSRPTGRTWPPPTRTGG